MLNMCKISVTTVSFYQSGEITWDSSFDLICGPRRAFVFLPLVLRERESERDRQRERERERENECVKTLYFTRVVE